MNDDIVSILKSNALFFNWSQLAADEIIRLRRDLAYAKANIAYLERQIDKLLPWAEEMASRIKPGEILGGRKDLGYPEALDILRNMIPEESEEEQP